MRPVKLYRNSTRFCVIRRGECSIVPAGEQAKVTLTRVGKVDYDVASCCDAPTLFRPCPPAPAPTPAPAPVSISRTWKVELPLVEVRDDGSVCALITNELQYLIPGRYTANVTGVANTPYCFAVEFLEARPEMYVESETPDNCTPCGPQDSCTLAETPSEQPPVFWER